MSTKDENINLLISEMYSRGIKNQNSQIGFLSVVSKENPSFIPTRENLYYTSEDRLRLVFPSYFPPGKDTTPYLEKPEALANYVYGGKFGNNNTGDGWKYRGGSYNQITFSNNFDSIGKEIKVDLKNNPEKIIETGVAEKAAIQYFIQSFKSINKDINSFNSVSEAVDGFLRANAGWPNKDVKGILGYDLAHKNSVEMEQKVKDFSPTKEKIKKTIKPIVIIGGISSILIFAVLYYNPNQKKKDKFFLSALIVFLVCTGYFIFTTKLKPK